VRGGGAGGRHPGGARDRGRLPGGAGAALPLGHPRRRLAALARAHRAAGHRLDTGHPAIRETLRGIGRRHGAPQRRAVALATAEVRKLVAACRGDLAGLRDRALLLLGYAAALRRSELAAVEHEHLRFTADGLELLLPRAKGDEAGEGAQVGVPRGQRAETCPVRAVEAWLRASAIRYGPVFCRVTRWGTVEQGRGLSGEGVRLVLLRRAEQAGVVGTHLEPVSPHGLRAGFVTQATRAGLPDEAIMAHTRHKDAKTVPAHQWQAAPPLACGGPARRRARHPGPRPAAKLAEMGVHEAPTNLRTKISRGRFSAVFFVHCLRAVGVRSLALDQA
jgi:integrase